MNDPTPFLRAQVLYDVRRWEEAAAAFSEVLARDPTHDAAGAYLAAALLQLDRPWDALPAAEQAVRAAPESTWALRVLSLAQQRRFYTAEAVASAEAAVRLGPSDASNHVRLAEASAGAADLATELHEARVAVALAPAWAYAHIALGRACLRSGDRASAEAALREALRLDPASAEALTELGGVLARAGRVPGALESYAQAIITDPASVTPRRQVVNAARLIMALLVLVMVAGIVVGLHAAGTSGPARGVIVAGFLLTAFGLGLAAWRLALPPTIRIALRDGLRPKRPAAADILSPAAMRAAYRSAQLNRRSTLGRASRRLTPWVVLLALSMLTWMLSVPALILGGLHPLPAAAARAMVVLVSGFLWLGSAANIGRIRRLRRQPPARNR